MHWMKPLRRCTSLNRLRKRGRHPLSNHLRCVRMTMGRGSARNTQRNRQVTNRRYQHGLVGECPQRYGQ